jgi:hypothetical protein
VPLKANDLETLQGYVSGVLARAEFHDRHVRAITLAVVGEIIAKGLILCGVFVIP